MMDKEGKKSKYIKCLKMKYILKSNDKSFTLQLDLKKSVILETKLKYHCTFGDVSLHRIVAPNLIQNSIKMSQLQFNIAIYFVAKNITSLRQPLKDF